MSLFGPLNIEKLTEKRDVEGLVNALDHKDAAIRRSAAERLGEFRDSRASGPLLAALRDPDFKVAASAARALSSIGDPKAIGPLIDKVVRLRSQPFGGDKSEPIAVELGAFGDAAVEPVMGAVKSGRLSVVDAIAALGAMGHSDSAVDALLALMEPVASGEEVPAVGSWIAEALEGIGTPRAIGELVALGMDWKLAWSVREGARKALKASGWQPRTAREGAWDAVARLIEEDDLFGPGRFYQREWRRWERGRFAIELANDLLSQWGSEVVAPLEAQASSSNPRIAFFATEILIAIKGDDSTAALERLATTMGAVSDPVHDEGTFQDIGTDSANTAKMAARELHWRSLENSGEPAGVERLIDAVRAQEIDPVRAAEIFARRGEERAVPVLIEALASRDEQVRASAGKSLQRINSPLARRAVSTLEDFIDGEPGLITLTSPNSPELDMLDWLLAKLTAEDAASARTFVERGWYLLRSGWRAVVDVLGDLADSAGLQALASGLQSDDAAVRAESARVLGYIRDPRAAPSLTAALRDPEERVRGEAANALRQMGLSETESGLSERLSAESEDP